MQKIKLSQKESNLLNNGTVISVGGNTYRYLPFWYKDTDEEGVYEEYSFEELPYDLIAYINDQRKRYEESDE